jgi:hypothetical protein
VRVHDGGVGSGVLGDPLVPCKSRPQVALARSIVAILEAYNVRIPASGPISDADAGPLPLVVLATLCAAGLLNRPVADAAAPTAKPSPYARTPRIVAA